jgi:hypothetical protein
LLSCIGCPTSQLHWLTAQLHWLTAQLHWLIDCSTTLSVRLLNYIDWQLNYTDWLLNYIDWLLNYIDWLIAQLHCLSYFSTTLTDWLLNYIVCPTSQLHCLSDFSTTLSVRLFNCIDWLLNYIDWLLNYIVCPTAQLHWLIDCSTTLSVRLLNYIDWQLNCIDWLLNYIDWLTAQLHCLSDFSTTLTDWSTTLADWLTAPRATKTGCLGRQTFRRQKAAWTDETSTLCLHFIQFKQIMHNTQCTFCSPILNWLSNSLCSCRTERRSCIQVGQKRRGKLLTCSVCIIGQGCPTLFFRRKKKGPRNPSWHYFWKLRIKAHFRYL